jgi:hypothetical protein
MKTRYTDPEKARAVKTSHMVLLALALFAAARIGEHSHGFGLVFLVAFLMLPWLWSLIRWAVRLWLDGFLLAKGAKAAGLFEREPKRPKRQHAPREPRAKHCREGAYFPWNDSLDGIGDEHKRNDENDLRN